MGPSLVRPKYQRVSEPARPYNRRAQRDARCPFIAWVKPHLARAFKVSNDLQFAEKLETIVGLYLNPPEHAIVLCADEKSQIQALDRTQPGLPLKKGRCGTMTTNGMEPPRARHWIIDNGSA
jgi:hypothetical protein